MFRYEAHQLPIGTPFELGIRRGQKPKENHQRCFETHALDKLRSHKSVGNMGKHNQKPCNMHIVRVWPGQCAPNLSHACHTVQILPTLVFTATKTAHNVNFERFAGVHIMGPVWAPNLLLDTTHMRLQDPSKTLDMLRWPKVRSEGPIVLMMLAGPKKPCPKPSVASGEASRTQPKIIVVFAPLQDLQGRGLAWRHLARRASALDHDGQARLRADAAAADPGTPARDVAHRAQSTRGGTNPHQAPASGWHARPDQAPH